MALVVGSGPNGLAAAITVAQAGIDVTVVESADSIGGGLRSGEQTLPGLLHDHCAAIVPTAVSSPFIESLNLESHGVHWAWPDIELVHPLDDGTAGVLYRSLDATATTLGVDGQRWKAVFVACPETSICSPGTCSHRWPRFHDGQSGWGSSAYQGCCRRRCWRGCFRHRKRAPCSPATRHTRGRR
ncbi:MAG: hypothetical protein QOG75_663 [Mycobacterium sp.]|jgi:phytoene dehydrogenase-like protein|nr:hypothetical protein [Mycobacterium sp.]